MAKTFDIALLVPSVSTKIPLVEGFLNQLKREYPHPILQTADLFCWSSSDTLGIIVSFDLSLFLPHFIKGIAVWAEEANANVYELMNLGEKGRQAFKDKFILTSDNKYFGEYDIAFVLKAVATRINATLGRKHARYDASIKVSFKTEKQFVFEYAKNISKGGIFVASDKPLPLRTKVELVLNLPHSPAPVKIIGEVVHVINAEQARLMNADRWPGMGIQFSEFEEDGEKVLLDYLKSLREGSPSTSE